MKNSLLKLEKDFIEIEDRELKYREVKTKRFKPIMVSVDDMDKFEQKEMNKIRRIKNTGNDLLVNYIPELIRKSVGSFKDKIVSPF